ncbi:hypothetical protein ACQ7B2_22300, partial [Escherichia coli]
EYTMPSRGNDARIEFRDHVRELGHTRAMVATEHDVGVRLDGGDRIGDGCPASAGMGERMIFLGVAHGHHVERRYLEL